MRACHRITAACLFAAAWPSAVLATWPSCPSSMVLRHMDPPRLPAATENTFEGSVALAVVVSPDGHVTQARVLASRLTPVGHGGRAAKGYEAAAVDAARTARFSSPPLTCQRNLPVRFAVVEATALDDHGGGH
ncbi:TonB family protein [Dyella terrae]|nr:TonB family protein [Dyella terrae]